MHKVTLLTKADCTRCDAARQAITKLVSNHATILVEEIDVAANPDLQAQYPDAELPILLVDDEVRFRQTVDPQQLARIFYDELGEKLLGFN